MEEHVINNILKICEILQKHNVDYLIVGGTALAFHGYYRMSRMSNDLPSEKHDFHFWYNPTYENYFRLLNAIEELGINVQEFKNEKAPNPKKSFFSHEFEEFKIDFLPEILGLDRFNSSFSKRITSDVRGVKIYILSKDDLVKSKSASSRNKDKDDLNELKALFPDDENN